MNTKIIFIFLLSVSSIALITASGGDQHLYLTPKVRALREESAQLADPLAMLAHLAAKDEEIQNEKVALMHQGPLSAYGVMYNVVERKKKPAAARGPAAAVAVPAAAAQVPAAAVVVPAAVSVPQVTEFDGYQQYGNAVTSLCAYGEGTIIAGYRDGFVRIWRFTEQRQWIQDVVLKASNSPIVKVLPYNYNVEGSLYNTGYPRLVIASADGVVQLLDGAKQELFPLLKHTKAVTELFYQPGSEYQVWSFGLDGRANKIDLRLKKATSILFNSPINCAVQVERDVNGDNQILLGFENGQIIRINLHTFVHKKVLACDQPIKQLHYTPSHPHNVLVCFPHGTQRFINFSGTAQNVETLPEETRCFVLQDRDAYAWVSKKGRVLLKKVTPEGQHTVIRQLNIGADLMQAGQQASTIMDATCLGHPDLFVAGLTDSRIILYDLRNYASNKMYVLSPNGSVQRSQSSEDTTSAS